MPLCSSKKYEYIKPKDKTKSIPIIKNKTDLIIPYLIARYLTFTVQFAKIKHSYNINERCNFLIFNCLSNIFEYANINNLYYLFI